MGKTVLQWGALILLMVVSCNSSDDDTPQMATLNLNFKASFGSDPLTMFSRDYDYTENMRVKFQLFQFYISDVTLIGSSGDGTEDHPLLDVALVSFKNVQSDEAATEGISFNLEGVPSGIYQGIRFGLGVSSDLNKTNPGDYEVGHPLTNHYWSASSGYVFTKVEGNADLESDGQFETPLTFHTGLDDMYREIEFQEAFDIRTSSTSEIPLMVDLKKILLPGTGNFIDFRVTSIDHTNDLDLAGFIMDNLKSSISLNN